MPFIYDETEVEWPDDGTEPAPPRPDQFVYLPPPEFGGEPEPVRFSAVVIPELRALGARRAYCRYDGGHDEGFCWLDSVELEDGGRISATALAQRAQGAQVLNKLYSLCDECASLLLGDGYGTGEYSMYGAFTVDLEACTITDDPGADPVVQNIRLLSR